MKSVQVHLFSIVLHSLLKIFKLNHFYGEKKKKEGTSYFKTIKISFRLEKKKNTKEENSNSTIRIKKSTIKIEFRFKFIKKRSKKKKKFISKIILKFTDERINNFSSYFLLLIFHRQRFLHKNLFCLLNSNYVLNKEIRKIIYECERSILET